MADEPDHEALKRLEERLAEVKRAHQPEPPKDEHYSQASLGWRMVIELVSGLGVGFAIGYGLDTVFDTLPLFLVVFVLLGFAAGVRVMLRTAKEVGDKQIGGSQADRSAGDKGN